MVDALTTQIGREESRNAFVASALEARQEVAKYGEVMEAADVHSWLLARAANGKAVRPRARKLVKKRVARLTYSPQATLDLERLQDFLAEHDPEWADAAVRVIVHGMTVLEQHPLIGRPAEEGMRELVISRGRTGYVALCTSPSASMR